MPHCLLIFPGDLRNENDANCTYEGENNILIQQASNFLISMRSKGWSAFNGASPLGSVDFFKDGEEIKKTRWTWKQAEGAINPESEISFCFQSSNNFLNH